MERVSRVELGSDHVAGGPPPSLAPKEENKKGKGKKGGVETKRKNGRRVSYMNPHHG